MIKFGGIFTPQKHQLSTITKCLDILNNMVCMRESSLSNNVRTIIIENPIVDTLTTYPRDEVVGTQVLDNCSHFIFLEVDVLECTNATIKK